jgi:hypothetical protein
MAFARNFPVRLASALFFLGLAAVQSANLKQHPPLDGSFSEFAPIAGQIAVAWSACCIGWWRRRAYVTTILGLLVLAALAFVTSSLAFGKIGLF